MMKVIEIQVRVIDTDGDEKWEDDPDFTPERICQTFEDVDDYGGVEFIYAEADEIKRFIEKVMNS